MSAVFSKSCEYGLQALLYIALKQSNGLVVIKDMATDMDIPQHFLGKILQILVKANILTSKKGPNGGFMISNQSLDVTALDVVRVIDGDAIETQCVSGFHVCDNDSPCPFHSNWEVIRNQIKTMLAGETIRSLVDKAIEGKRTKFIM